VRVGDRHRRREAERLLSGALGAEVHTDSIGDALSARVTDPARAPHALARLADAGIGIAGFQLARPSLDEVFLTLTGQTVKTPAEATP
jgi:ABC-2 type transport system ATP-binding protein